MGTEADERIRNPDVELHRDHPRRLVHRPPQVLAVVDGTRDHAKLGFDLDRKQRLGHDAGKHGRVDCLVVESGP